MCNFMSKFLLLMMNILYFVSANYVFHVNSKISFHPNQVADFFGYSIVLSEMGLYVGAPKAKNSLFNNSYIGEVFKCLLNNMDKEAVDCYPIKSSHRNSAHFVDGMWYGASMTETNNNLLICAPRYTELRKNDRLLENGACFMYDLKTEYEFHLPLASGPAFIKEGGKKNYGEYDEDFVYYAYAQIGISVANTNDGDFLIGAPGVLQWTGVIIGGRMGPITFMTATEFNPAYTKDIEPDDYFGYSVASGVFEKNGTVLNVVAAPRSNMTFGKILIFEKWTNETEPLKIKAKIHGPQIGAYFGAALCVMDLNGDGLSDLLVGAPNYATEFDGHLNYDQGAVFVYITKNEDLGLTLQEAGSVKGSEVSKARFGTAIADLGDIDGDGFSDVAIGAPWENDGSGAVYIYRGYSRGLMSQVYQKLHADGALGFGNAIAKGYDVDNNGVNDLAIGAHISGTAYLYRSIPTIQVIASIEIPNIKDIVKSTSSFNALFCVTVEKNEKWLDYNIDLATTMIVDSGNNSIQTNDVISVSPGKRNCYVRNVGLKVPLGSRVTLEYFLKPYREIDIMSRFPKKCARLSESSVLKSSVNMSYSDCVNPLLCNSWFEMTLKPLEKNVYVPGSSKLGFTVTVRNSGEPAYGVKLFLVVPSAPKRLPSTCHHQDLDVICDLPEPLERNKNVNWEIELDYTWDGKAKDLLVTARLDDPVISRNITDGPKELAFNIIPYSTYKYRGKSINKNKTVARETLSGRGDVFVDHYYELINLGPSNMYDVKLEFSLQNGVSLVNQIDGATLKNFTLTLSPFMLPVNTTKAYILSLRFNLTRYGQLLEENGTMNLTSTMHFHVRNGFQIENGTISVVTTLFLEPDVPHWTRIWPIIVGTLTGLLLLAAIILTLNKYGFFSRKTYNKLPSSTPKEEPTSSVPLQSATE